MKLNFKKPLVGGLAATLVTLSASASELKFSVETTKNQKVTVYQTSGHLIGEDGVCVLGLPNGITVKEISALVKENSHKAEVLSYDAYGRFAFVRVPKTVSEGKKITKVEVSAEKSLKAGTDSTFTVAGKVGRHDGKVLPFSFLRMHKNGYTLTGKNFPFLKSSNGALAGMLHSEVPNAKGAFYAIPGELIAKGLDDIKTFGLPTRAWVGVTLDANIDLPVVKSVRPASPAAKAGLEKGDIISSIAGKATSNYGEAVKAFYLLKAEKEVKFEIVRGEEVKHFDFSPKKFPRATFPL